MRIQPLTRWPNANLVRSAISTEEELRKTDLALINLVCAQGLPGAEHLDIDFCLRQVDMLTERVRSVTERSMYAFHRDPADFENSEAYFRVLTMITVLQRDCGIKYNPGKIPDDATFYPEDSFIFGIFQGGGGTCASLPVLYAAFGRRLGYPIKLVLAPNHCFCRWDGPGGEWFNIEATAPGLSTPSDQQYEERFPAEAAELKKYAGGMLSKSPKLELAGFLNCRFEYWWGSKHYRNAVNCCAWCAELDGHPYFIGKLDFWVNEWRKLLAKRSPFHFQVPAIDMPPRRFRLIPEQLEWMMVATGVADDLLRIYFEQKHWMQPAFTQLDLHDMLLMPFRRSLSDIPWKFADEHSAW